MHRRRVWIGSVVLLVILGACLLPSAAYGQTDSAGTHDIKKRADHGLFADFINWVSLLVEVGGVTIILLAVIITSVVFLLHVSRGITTPEPYQQYRKNLGRGILLGLEFLVAGDIIGTVAVDPTFANLGVLGLIVVIRTFLSWSLEVEIHGRWPWEGEATPARGEA